MDKYPMKSITTTLLLIILLAGCAERERYAERYLDSVTLVLHMDGLAEVSGFLKKRFEPGDALECPDMAGMRGIKFNCSSEDYVTIIENLQDCLIPVAITTSISDAIPSVEYLQEGITWKPNYQWSVREGFCSFTATVLIVNSTGREWFTESIMMMDMLNEPVCRLSDTLIIPAGELELGWWHAEGTAHPLTLFYGWPINAGWNQLIPCHVPDAGQIVPAGDETHEWPVRTGDTLWIQAEHRVELRETVEQKTDGYSCLLEIRNGSERFMEIKFSHPDILPRGAEFVEVECFPAVLELYPGEQTMLKYDLIYDVSS
jgi:hypothetical protein